jgi:tetratricopeptide (TPR) repeat protein
MIEMRNPSSSDQRLTPISLLAFFLLSCAAIADDLGLPRETVDSVRERAKAVLGSTGGLPALYVPTAPAPPAPPVPSAPAPKGPIVKEIEVQYAGPATFSRERILASMSTCVGGNYSEQVVERDIRAIYNTGRIQNVRIFGKPLIDGVRIIVVLQCRPTISEILIQGVTPSVESALRKQIGFATDVWLDGSDLASDRQQIIDFYTRTGMGPVDVEYSADIDEKLGTAKVVFSIHDAPEEDPGAKSAESQWGWMLAFLTPEFYAELVEKSKNALLRRINALECATLVSPENEVAWLHLGDAYVQLGIGYSRTGDTKETISALRKAVTLLPRDATAWQYLGGLLIAESPNEALDALDHAVKADPESLEGWVIRGTALIELRRFDEAKMALDKATALQPNSRAVWVVIAWLYMAEGRIEDFHAANAKAWKMDPEDNSAQSTVSTARQIFPRTLDTLRPALQANPEDQFARGEILMRLVDAALWEEAAAEAKKFVDRSPSDKAAWAILGQADLKREHWKEGVEEMEKAHSLGFDTPESLVEFSRGLIELGRLDDAEKILIRFIRTAPKSADAFALLGLIYRKENRIAESNAYSKQALETGPENTTALLNLAINSMEMKQFSDAIDYAYRVSSHDPLKSRAWELVGSAEEQLGDTDAAAKAFKEVTELQPEKSPGWLGLARTSSDYQQACDAARKAAEVDGDNTEAQATLGITQARFGRNTEALRSFRSVTVQSPANDIALRGFNDLFIPLKRTEAVKVLEYVTDNCPESQIGWRMLSQDYLLLERLPEAVDALKRATRQSGAQTDPDFPGVLADLVQAATKSGDLEIAEVACEQLEKLAAPLAKSLRKRYLQQVKPISGSASQ